MQRDISEPDVFCTVCASPVGAEPKCPICGRSFAGTAVAASQASPTKPGRRSWSFSPARHGRLMTLLYLIPALALIAAVGSWGTDAYQTNRAEARDYHAAEQALADGRLLDAKTLFERAGDYSDAPRRAAATDELIAPYARDYEVGEAALESGDFARAIELLTAVAAAIPNYRDVAALVTQAQQGQAAQLKANAQRAFAAQNWLLAEQLYTKLAAAYPNDPDIAASLLDLRREHALFVYTVGSLLTIAVPGQSDPITVTAAVTASWPVWSPDRNRIAFVSPGDANNGNARGLYVVNPDGTGLKRLADFPVQYQPPVWSPDGTRIAFVVDRVTAQHTSMRTSVVVIDVATGKAMEVADRKLPNASSPTWSPSGDRIAFVSRAVEHLKADSSVPDEILRVDRSSVYVYDFATGATTNVGGDALPEPYKIAWSPTADQILVFSRMDGTSFGKGKLYLADVKTNAVTLIDGSNIDVSMPVWSPNGAQFAYVVHTQEIRVLSTQGDEYALTTDVNLSGSLTWSPSGDRLLAPGSTGIGTAALATVGATGGSVRTIPLVYDADGGDAGPPDWAGLRGDAATAGTVPSSAPATPRTNG